MRLEQQVVSLKLAKKLKELIGKQTSVYCWKQWSLDGSISLEPYCNSKKNTWAAYTVAELGEILTSNGCKMFKSIDEEGKWCAWHGSNNFKATTEADARAKLLIYLLENKLITLN